MTFQSVKKDPLLSLNLSGLIKSQSLRYAKHKVRLHNRPKVNLQYSNKNNHSNRKINAILAKMQSMLNVS